MSGTAAAVLYESCPHRAILACMNISHAADLWLGDLASKGHSDRTVDTYRRLLDKLADEHHRHVDVADLTVAHVRGFLDRQSRRDGKRKSPATVAQNVSVVCGFFDWLTGENIIPRNPTRRNGDRIMSRPRQVRPANPDGGRAGAQPGDAAPVADLMDALRARVNQDATKVS